MLSSGTMAPKATVLEINLISAQELRPSRKASRSNMQTYVVAWINPQQKLTSRVDAAGGKNPTWNDKFIFAIEEDLPFERPNSTFIFEIYCKRRCWKDKLIGRVHVLLDCLIDRNHRWDTKNTVLGYKVVAFHVRTPSGKPDQGILNIGVKNLDGWFNHKAMPNFLSSISAIDYRKLMGGSTPIRSCFGAKLCAWFLM